MTLTPVKIHPWFDTPFTIPVATKIWPCKTKNPNSNRVWCTKPTQLQRPIVVEDRYLAEIGTYPNLTHFIQANIAGKKAYVMVLFSRPMIDPTDAVGVFTIGFVYNVPKEHIISR